MDLSFQYFWEQVSSNPLLFLAVLLTMGVILVNGWTDAPNAIISISSFGKFRIIRFNM